MSPSPNDRRALRWASLRRFAREERGTIAIMSAVIALASIGALAIGVDSASLYVERRRAQSAVDLAAIAAARDMPRAEAAARSTITDNRVTDVQSVLLVTGNYTPDPALPPVNRFVPNATPRNAVRVELHSRAPLYFARAIMPEDNFLIVTRATAVNSAAAAFSVGSRLLSLNGGVLNAVLGKMIDGNLSLTLMDYESLAAMNVDLFRFSDALSTRVSGRIGTYDELAASEASVANVADALSEIARTDSHSAAYAALRTVGNTGGARNQRLPLKQFVNFGPHGSAAIGEGGAAFSARASALYLLAAAAQIANANRQVEVMSKLQVPGLASLSVGVTIGERPQSSPWIGFGHEDVRVYTAQTRVRLLAEVGGGGLLAGAALRLPVYLDIAAAEARLLSVTCGSDPSRDARVRIGVRPSVADLWIAEPANASDWARFRNRPAMVPALLVSANGMVEARGRAHGEIASLHEQTVSFDWSDVASARAKTVRTRDYAAALTASLLGDLDLDVRAGPLAVATPALLGKAAVAALAPASRAIDSVIRDLTEVLGIGLGEADVRVHGVRCDGAVLVN